MLSAFRQAARRAPRQAPLVAHFFSSTSSSQTSRESFEAHVEALQQLPEVGNSTKLKLYALFKQANEGPCAAPKPGAFDFVGKAKWQAWTDLGQLSAADAMTRYVEICAELGAVPGAAPAAVASAEAVPESADDSIVTSLDDEGVFTVRLNRPAKYNAITVQMYKDLTRLLNEAGENRDVRATLLTGTGDFYCSGNDLSNFDVAGGDLEAFAADAAVMLEEFVDAFISHPKPLVAGVNGPAVGIAVTTLGLCDAVLASHRATFNTPFTSLGQSPEGCSSVTFPRLMGAGAANEVLLFNRKLTAEEALERRLVTRVEEHSQLPAAAAALARDIARLPPQSMAHSKALVREHTLEELRAVNRRECAVLHQRWLSDECMAAVMSFLSR